jgi:hypothetical protein
MLLNKKEIIPEEWNIFISDKPFQSTDGGHPV